MPRSLRIAPPATVQHVVNRGNFRQTIFREPDEYEDFLDLLGRAAERFQVPLLAYCLMPNHFHLVLWPPDREALSAYMHWVTSTHVRHLHYWRGTNGLGHIYQERFRNRIVKDERQLLDVCRYVEANPLSAGLVARAEDWPYCSLRRRRDRHGRELLAPWPISRPADWLELVNERGIAAHPNGEVLIVESLGEGRPSVSPVKT